MDSKKLNNLINKIIAWGNSESQIVAIGLVGSYANNTYKDSSDIDLVILCNDKEIFINTNEWINKFGTPLDKKIERYGLATSVRVWYEKSFEVEFCFVLSDWADIPVDSGTKQVVQGGIKILLDKEDLLVNLCNQLNL